MSDPGLSRRSLLGLVATTGAIAISGSLSVRSASAADAWPERPVKIVVGFAPGGYTDIIARALAEPLSQALGQRFIVENQPGGSGVLAAAAVARAPGDGYTLLMGHITANAAAPALMPSLPYDPLTAFAPVTLAAIQPHVVLANPRLGLTTIADLISRAKQAPGKLTYASSGPGSVQHLAGELFKLKAGVDLVHVPYRGSGPALNDLVAGHVDLGFDGIGSAQGHLDAGTLKALAVTTPRRVARFPDLPTLAEAGLEGYDMASWFGLFAPAGVPWAIVDRLYAETTKALRSPVVVKVLRDAAAEPGGQPPDAFAAFVRAEAARLGALIKSAGIAAG